MQWSEPGRRFGPPRTIGAVNAPALVENQCRPKGKVAAGATACCAEHQRQPAEAMAAGVAMIHQHFMLIEAMTVVENVMLGWSQAGWILKRAEIAARIRETSGRFGLDLNPDAVIGKCRSVVGSASSPAALSPAWAEPCYPFSRSEPLPTA
jgi:hypothetical protein